VSLQLALLSAVSRTFIKPMIRHARDPGPLRRRFERAAPRLLRMPPYALLRPISLAPGLEALSITARPGTCPPDRRRIVLYFHGGAFVAGSPRTHAAMLARLARLARVEIVAPAYRLAPEHPFPAAVDDARAAWDALIARGHAPDDIVIGGDSAGGNLALGLLASVLGDGVRPAGLFAFSPVTDLTFSGASVRENRGQDAALPAERADDMLGYYLAGAAPDDPRASPLFAEYPDAPPVFLQFASTEILRDDCRRMADRLRAAGAEVTVDEWADAPHVWVMFDGYLPEAREGLRRAARFIDSLPTCAQAGAITPAPR